MPTTDEILGVHMVGPMVSELISEAVVAMEFKASERRHRPHLPRPPLAVAKPPRKPPWPWTSVP